MMKGERPWDATTRDCYTMTKPSLFSFVAGFLLSSNAVHGFIEISFPTERPIRKGRSSISLWHHHAIRTQRHSIRLRESSTQATSASQSEDENLLELNATGLSPAFKEAEELRRKARTIMAEALALEEALHETRQAQTKKKEVDSQVMLDRIFQNRPLTPEAVARVLRDERWSVDQMVDLLESLYRKQVEASSIRFARASEQEPLSAGSMTVSNQTDIDLTGAYLDCLIDAAVLLDNETDVTNRNRRLSGGTASALKSRLKEWIRADEADFQRRLAADVQAAVQSNTSIQEYMRRSLGMKVLDRDDESQLNVSGVHDDLSMFPLWVPSSLLDLLVASPGKLSSEDYKAIKEVVLGSSSFFCTSSDAIQNAAIYRGNLRPRGSQSAEMDQRNVTVQAFLDIQNRMESEGLAERVQLFLLQDPEWTPKRDSSEVKPKPVIIAVPSSIKPEETQQSPRSILIRRASLALAVVTTFTYSISCYALNPTFFKHIISKQEPSALSACLPVFAGVGIVQLVHEAAHSLVAKIRGIKIGRPIPIPSPHLGTFGCVTPLKSFPSNRAAMLDLALSGPVSSSILSLIFMVAGVHQTVRASPAALAHFPVVPVAVFKSSFLTGTILSFLAPKAMMLPLSQPIPIHPLFMIGFSGLLVSALNLLPIFRLDGGRACAAAMGPRFGGVASASTLLFLLSMAFTDNSSLAMMWIMFVLFCQRQTEVPVRNDVTEVDDFRFGAWIASLATAILSLLPFPGAGFL